MTMSSPQNDKVESIHLTNSNSSSSHDDDGTAKRQQACTILMESAMTSGSDSGSGSGSVEDPTAIMDATAALVSHVSPDCANDETIASQTTAPDPSHHHGEEPTIATQLDPYFAHDNSTSHHHGEEEDDDDDNDDDLSDFGEVMGSASATNLLFSNNNSHEDDTFSFPPRPPPSMPPPPPPTTTALEEENDATQSSPNDTDDSDEESWNRPQRRPRPAAPRSAGAGHRLVDTFRKAGVAVAGGTLTAVGLVMIPLPTPMGCVVAGSGMALLGTEFEAANRVLASVQSSAEAARDRLIDNVEQTLLQEDNGTTATMKKKDPKAPEIVIKDKLKQQQQQQQQQSSGDDENLNHSNHDNSQQDKKTAEEEDDDDEDDTSAMVIQVRADAYFEPDDDPSKHQRRFFRSASSTDSNSPGFLAGTRQKLRQDTRGFLATRVLPFLHKTKQFGSAAAAAPQPPK